MAEFKSEGIWMTESYACGSVFTDSVLDFLASAVSFLFTHIRIYSYEAKLPS